MYLGLGTDTIGSAFVRQDLPSWAFVLKIVFTAVTVGSGFLGGEVTPLFFVGATLGNVMARALGIPLALGAGVGLAAVFAASANTPLALSIMAAELLGASAFPHVVIVAAVAYLLVGHRSIYPAQRLVQNKGGERLGSPRPLRDLRAPSTGAPSSRSSSSPKAP
jgi:H+/Cl- antiporter ClcA